MNFWYRVILVCLSIVTSESTACGALEIHPTGRPEPWDTRLNLLTCRRMTSTSALHHIGTGTTLHIPCPSPAYTWCMSALSDIIVKQARGYSADAQSHSIKIRTPDAKNMLSGKISLTSVWYVIPVAVFFLVCMACIRKHQKKQAQLTAGMEQGTIAHPSQNKESRVCKSCHRGKRFKRLGRTYQKWRDTSSTDEDMCNPLLADGTDVCAVEMSRLSRQTQRRRHISNDSMNTATQKTRDTADDGDTEGNFKKRVRRRFRTRWSHMSCWSRLLEAGGVLAQYVCASVCCCLPFTILEWLGIVTPENELERQKHQIGVDFTSAGFLNPLDITKPPLHEMHSVHSIGDNIEVTQF
jgi:hypothetical protein